MNAILIYGYQQQKWNYENEPSRTAYVYLMLI